MTRIARVGMIAIGLLSAKISFAGVYSDGLGRCLVSHTSAQDKTQLVRWIFSTMSLHPAVSDTSNLTDADRDKINRSAGMLFERLLTTDCRNETKEALMYEGPFAMQLAFQVLGQAAVGGLLTDPSVAAGVAAFQKYMDANKLRELGPGLAPSQPDPAK
jgi:hypothetical protein